MKGPNNKRLGRKGGIQLRLLGLQSCLVIVLKVSKGEALLKPLKRCADSQGPRYFFKINKKLFQKLD